MKKNVYHFTGISIFILLCLILSCRKVSSTKDSITNVSLSSEIISAKQWHSDKVAAFGPLLSIMQNKINPIILQPKWKDAYLSNLSDGTNILVVPTDERTLHNNQISIFREFIFTFSNNTITGGNIVEFLGDEKFLSSHKDDLISKEKQNQIEGYSGYIISYDINYVYQSGAVYQDGIRNEKLQAQLKAEPQNKNNNGAGIQRTTDGAFPKKVNVLSNDVCIATYVTMVYVDGDGSEYEGTPILLNVECPPTVTQIEPGSTISVYGGTALESSHGPNVIGNIRDYLKCFDNIAGQGYSYSVKLCVDQPNPGQRDPWGFTSQNGGNPINVGHTFLVFTETKPDGSTITRNVGFYPSQAVYPGSQSANGELDNNSAHGYNISLDISVDNSSFTTMLNSVMNRADVTYNLSSNNCTTFALNTLSAAGINISATTGSWAGGSGKNPGDLGEDLRGMSLASNMAINTSGAAHPDSGTCY
jgi:hypothetical protein